MMQFPGAVRLAFDRYGEFSGRSFRPEYWWFVLFLATGELLLAGLDFSFCGMSNTGFFGFLFGLVTIVPFLAVSVRRLHDIDKSGWWLLIAFIPLVGTIVLIVWACKPGTEGDTVSVLVRCRKRQKQSDPVF